MATNRHLRPTRFETEPNSITAEKEWKHWYRCFANYIDIIIPAVATNEDDAAPGAQALAEVQQKKLSTLINFISASIYDYVADAADYDSAITVLQNLYVKPRSVIFNRHQLATSKQNAGETVDQFMQNLEKLSKHCEFTQVTA